MAELYGAWEEGGAKSVELFLLAVGTAPEKAYEIAREIAIASGEGLAELDAQYAKKGYDAGEKLTGELAKIPGKVKAALSGLAEGLDAPISQLAVVFGEGGARAVYEFARSMGMTRQQAYDAAHGVAVAAGEGFSELDRIFMEETEGATNWIYLKLKEAEPKIAEAVVGIAKASGAGLDQLTVAFKDGGANAIYELLLELGMGEAEAYEQAKAITTAAGRGIRELDKEFEESALKRLPEEMAELLKGISEETKIAFVDIASTWEQFGTVGIYKLLESLGVAKEKIGEIIAALDEMGGSVEESTERAVGVFEKLPGAIMVALTDLSSAFDEPLDNLVHAFREGGVQAVAALLEEMGVAPKEIELIVDMLTRTAEAAEYVGEATEKGMGNAEITVENSALADKTETMSDETIAAAGKLETGLPEKAEAGTSGMEKAITEGQPGVTGAVQGMVDAAGSAADQLAEKFFTAGRNAAEGLARGMEDPAMIRRVQAAAAFLGATAEGALKGRLEQRSPSKVFMEIGEFAGEGFAIGLRESMLEAVKAVNASTGGLVDRMMDAVQIGHERMLATIGGVNSNSVYNNQTSNQTIHFNQPVSSPYQTARQVRKAMEEMLYGQ